MKNSTPMGVGVISIFTVLLVLVLTVFSALTLSTANADMALSRRNGDTVQAYYAADTQAVEALAQFEADWDAQTLDERFPITDLQSLSVYAQRDPFGEVTVRRWQVVYNDEETEFTQTLPVWQGGF